MPLCLWLVTLVIRVVKLSFSILMGMKERKKWKDYSRVEETTKIVSIIGEPTRVGDKAGRVTGCRGTRPRASWDFQRR